MKHILVLFGSHANRLLLVEDSVADTAVADKWALDAEEFPATGFDTNIPDDTPVGLHDRPQSLIDFEAGNLPAPEAAAKVSTRRKSS